MDQGSRQWDPLSPFFFLIVFEGFNVLKKKFVVTTLRKANIIIHLQSEDDTMIISGKKWSNMWIINKKFLLLKVMSDLKVNFHKSLIEHINFSQKYIVEVTNILNYSLGSLPLNYRGFPIEENSNRKDTSN